MLKLLKYELIGSYRQYFLTFVLYLLLCLMTPFLPDFISNFTMGLIMVAVFGISISIFVNIVLYFNNSMYKKGGYLTLTLPVSTKSLVLSKWLGAMIWSVLAGIILLIGLSGLLILAVNVPLSDLLTVSADFVKSLFDNISVLLKGIFHGFLSLSSGILSLYFTVTFVHTKFVRKYKTVVGIVGYIIAAFLFGILLEQITMQSIFVNLSTNQLFWISCLFEGLLCAVFYFGSVYLIDHYIEIE